MVFTSGVDNIVVALGHSNRSWKNRSTSWSAFEAINAGDAGAIPGVDRAAALVVPDSFLRGSSVGCGIAKPAFCPLLTLSSLP
jgi:hypothetical protein